MIEITVSKNELLSKLKAVSKVINTSNKVTPAHANFLFEIGSEFKVTGADAAGNITATVDCRKNEPEKPFRFLVETKTILEGLKELPEQPLTLQIDVSGKQLTLYHQSGKYKIQTLPSEGFYIPRIDETVSKLVKLPGKHFISGIKAVHHFAGNDELRPIMMTVYIESIKANLSFCATDASTLAVLDTAPDDIEFNDFNVALPIKLARIASEMIAMDEDVELEITSKNVALYFGAYKAIYRLTEGTYPDFRRIIPHPRINRRILKTNTNEFVSALRRASIFANKNSSLIELTISDHQVKISGRDIDHDQLAEETLSGYFDKEGEFKIGFGSTLLLKCIEAIETEEIRMFFSEPNKACLIRPDDVNIAKTILIMPLEINL